MVPSALALAFVTSVNLLITSRLINSRVMEDFRGRRKHLKPTDADAELGAYRMANLCAGMLGAPASVGIPARSLANVRCGGTTCVSTCKSNFMRAIFIFGFISLGGKYVFRIPISALAGVIASAGIRLLKWGTVFRFTALAVLMVNAIVAVAPGCSMYWLHWVFGRFTSQLGLLTPSPLAVSD